MVFLQKVVKLAMDGWVWNWNRRELREMRTGGGGFWGMDWWGFLGGWIFWLWCSRCSSKTRTVD